MSSPYVGEIRMFGGSFAPAGWALCQGQLISISENETLFNLIGTTYGGDGQATFALPNLCGRVPIHQGQGPGISQNYVIGETGGVEQVTLTTQQMPSHNHTFITTQTVANDQFPANNTLAQTGTFDAYNSNDPVAAMAPCLTSSGGNQPHENMQPFLVVTYIISLFGIFPTQN